MRAAGRTGLGTEPRQKLETMRGGEVPRGDPWRRRKGGRSGPAEGPE